MNPPVLTLGQRVRRQRTARGLTLREAADAIGMSKTWVADLERGRHLPTDEGLLEQLAFCLRDDWTTLLDMAREERALRAAQALHGGARVAPRSFEDLEAVAHRAAQLLHPIEAQEGEAIPVLFDLRDPAETGRRLGLQRKVEVLTYAWDASEDPEARVRLRGDRLALELREDVWARAAAGEARDRFTVAHLLGHAVLHQELLERPAQPALEDRATTTRPDEPQAYESAEWQATTFALAFLLPLDAVATYLARQRAASFTLQRFAEHFGVSQAAAVRRIEQLLGRLAAQHRGG